MADTTVTPNNGEDTGKQVVLQRIYIRDCSFESPRAPAVFATPVSPEVKVNMRSDTNKLGDDSFEVVLTVTIEAQAESRSIFLVEVHQAGLFSISGFNDQELGAVLGSYCPGILFPYAREAVSDLVQKGSMPTLLLQPVNFDAIYMQSIDQAAPPAGNVSIPA
ncbi:MAG TPA: protein-export chaperone SecB [Gammaproteobacteria bacterium]|nr:protein-export chaperone SecB [Gammaproteobacteria bacterium]